MSLNKEDIDQRERGASLSIRGESNVGKTGDEQLDHLNKQFWTEEYFPVASRLYQRLTDDMDYFHSVQTTDR